MNPSSPLQVLSPSVRNSRTRTPRSASRKRGSVSVSVSVSPIKSKSLRRNNNEYQYKNPLSVFEDAENQAPDTMERPMSYKFDDFLSKDDDEEGGEDVAYAGGSFGGSFGGGGGGGGVRESSPFLEIPHNAGRSSVRSTPRKAMVEMDTPADPLATAGP
ncbi:hypothetical protein KEM56_002660, partial [Ascosphaera pollenicola]